LRDDVALGQLRGADLPSISLPWSPFVLGGAFLALEIRELADMIARGAAPQRSAFLSAFLHPGRLPRLHVAAGLVWLAVMMAQVAVKASAPPWSAGCFVLSRCFGTPSTSSGFGCSRSSI